MSGPLHLDDVTVELGGKPVVDAVTLRVPDGAWVSLIGPNGAGKTTALRAIAGSVPYRGRIVYGDVEVSRLRERDRAKTIAVVPQQPEQPAGMRVADYVLLGRSPYVHYLGTEGSRDHAVVEAQLDRLDLRRFADRTLTTLSGGEFQRAVLARALAQEAPLLLLDEPTSSLDLGHAQQVLELVDELRHERGLTVVSALHDLTAAGQFSDELALLVDGRLVAAGTATEVLTATTIGTHYGADVRVIDDPVCGATVIPHRIRAGGRQ